MKTRKSYWIQYDRLTINDLYKKESEVIKTKFKLLKRVDELLKDKGVEEFNISKMYEIIKK